MNAMSLFTYTYFEPFAAFGCTGPLWRVNGETILYTWVGMALLFAGIAYTRTRWCSKTSLVYMAIETCARAFGGLCADSIGYFRRDYFSFIASLFTFTFIGCAVSLLPYMDEATKDLNTTTALALISFLYVCYKQIAENGIVEFFAHFLGSPEMPMAVRIAMSPMEVLGRFSKIISMSFRLFGNVFGGAMVYHLALNIFQNYQELFVIGSAAAGVVWVLVFTVFKVKQKHPLGAWVNSFVQMFFLLAWLQMFFGVLESVVQAFVLAMLTMTYLGMSVHHNQSRDKRAIPWS